MPMIVHPLCIPVQSLERRVRLYRERGWYSASPAMGSVSWPPAVMFPQPATVRTTSNNTFPLPPSFSIASINVGTLDSADARKPAHAGGAGLAVTGMCLFLQKQVVAAEFDLIGF